MYVNVYSWNYKGVSITYVLGPTLGTIHVVYVLLGDTFGDYMSFSDTALTTNARQLKGVLL